MLRITRRAGERIVLGDNVIIEVTEVKRGAVRIGIEAPDEVPVQREEIVFELPQDRALELGAA